MGIKSIFVVTVNIVVTQIIDLTFNMKYPKNIKN